MFARALLSFERPLLSVDVSMCLCVCLFSNLMINTSETERLIGRAQYEAYRKVHMVRRLMTSSVTSRDSMTSHIRHSLQSRHIRKLEPGSTIRVDCRPVKHTIS